MSWAGIMMRQYFHPVSVDFGMGATPNAMANMQAVCEKYEPSVKGVSACTVNRKFICGFFKQSGDNIFY